MGENENFRFLERFSSEFSKRDYLGPLGRWDFCLRGSTLRLLLPYPGIDESELYP